MTKDRNPDSRKNSSLARLVSRGALWQFGGGTITSIIRLGASAVLARLLDPIDFGIMGMGILAMNALAYFGNMGIPAAIIAKKKVSNEDLYTGFCLLSLNRIILYIIAFIGAPFLAKFFNEPKVVNLFRIVSIVFLLSALEAIPRCLLVKELRYRDIFFINFLTSIVESTSAIFLVIFTDLKYWALVISMLIAYIFTVLMINIIVRWRPSLRFAWKSFNFYKSYIINGLGTSVSLYLKQNIDYIIVGRVLGASALGLYEYAYKIPHMFVDRFIFPVSSVLFPALSKIQDDEYTSSYAFFRALCLIACISFPILFFLMATADLIVRVLWGDKWLSIVTPLRILCFAAAIQSLAPLANHVFFIKQRPDLVFRNNIIQLIFTLIFVCIGAYLYGINGIAIGVLIGTIPILIFMLICFKILEISYKQLYCLVLLFFFALASSLLTLFCLNNLDKIFVFGILSRLLISVTFGALFYVLMVYFFLNFIFEDFKKFLSSIFSN